MRKHQPAHCKLAISKKFYITADKQGLIAFFLLFPGTVFPYRIAIIRPKQRQQSLAIKALKNLENLTPMVGRQTAIQTNP